jgi:hypothetical protein
MTRHPDLVDILRFLSEFFADGLHEPTQHLFGIARQLCAVLTEEALHPIVQESWPAVTRLHDQLHREDLTYLWHQDNTQEPHYNLPVAHIRYSRNASNYPLPS